MADDEKLCIRSDYIRLWKEVLGELLGWSSEQVECWAARFPLMGDSDSIFYHYSALYYISDILVPATVSQTGGKEHSHFQAAIETALNGGDPSCETRTGIDWAAARARVEQLLQSVGSSLTEVVEQVHNRGLDQSQS
jgi:hypothetical protein